MPDKRYFIPFIVGFNALLVQLVFIRELTNLFNGTEIILGITLGFWMLGTGIGGIAGDRLKNILPFLVLNIFAPLVAFFIIRSGREIIGVSPSRIVGLTPVLFFTPLVILPFSFFSGVLFPLSTKLFSSIEVKKVYMMEAAGSFIGGILFTFVLVSTVSHLYIIFIVSFLYVFAFFLIKPQFMSLLKFTSFLVLVSFSDADKKLLYMFWYPFIPLVSRETPYQNITIIKDKDISSVYGAGEFYFSYPEPIRKETFIDPSVVFAQGNRGLYLGYDEQIVEELKRFEINPDIVVEDKIFKDMIDGYIFKKGNSFLLNPFYVLRKRRNYYDIIVGDIPPPYTLYLNRFYTFEFFKIIYGSLRNKGVYIFQYPGGENYLSEGRLKIVALIRNTMERVFDRVEVLPGEELLFIGMKKRREVKDVIQLWREKGKDGLYVNNVYIRDRFSFFRKDVLAGIDTIKTKINRIFYPESFIMFNTFVAELTGDKLIAKFFLSIKTKFIYILIILIGIILFIFPLLRRKNIFSTAIGISGATEIGMEIISIYVFQSIYGNAYRMMGIIFAFFMLGLATGSYLFRKGKEKIKFFIVELILVVYPLLFLVFLYGVRNLNLPIFTATVLFSLWAFISGGAGGFQYNVCTQLYGKDRAGFTYGTDLMGSFLGSIILTFFLIPFTGIFTSLVSLSLFNFIIVFLYFVVPYRGRGFL